MIDYIQINPNIKLPIIDGFNPFKAILVIDHEYSNEWQVEVSEWLVISGCKYMFAWGLSCSSWDDSVDIAEIELRQNTSDYEVITTWHDDEILTDVFKFAKMVIHEDYVLSNTLIIHVSNKSNKKKLIAEYEHA
jgi:hypothetical protein